jgi:outer membrane protein
VLYARDQSVIADHAVSAAKGALVPRVSLQGQYERSKDLVATGIGINDFTVTAQLHIPFYQGGGEYAQVRETKQQATQARYNTADAERQVRQQLRVSEDTLRNERAAVPLSEKQVEATRVAFEGARAETVIGERGTLEVLISEEDFVNAQASLLTARRNAFVAAFQVLATVGGMTAEALQLPVKLYDPRAHYREDAGRPFGFGDTSEADRRAAIEQNVSARRVEAGPIDVNDLISDTIAAPSTPQLGVVSKPKAK